MIKIVTKRGDTSCDINGTLAELYADTLSILQSIYEGVKEVNEKAAENYKKSIIRDVADAFMTTDQRIEKLKSLIDELDSLVEEQEEKVSWEYQFRA